MPAQAQQVPSPPRVVAISGMIFAVLYIVSLVLVRLAVPADPAEPGSWLADPSFRNWVRIALDLIPFTGIAFLWFMGVLRNRIGLLEDRFFATVFLGSGLLFVAMLFAAVSVARGLLDTFAAGFPRPERNLSTGPGNGIHAHEHVRHEDGRRIHVRDVYDRPSHWRFCTLGLVRWLRAWPRPAVGHHRSCLDRTGLSLVGSGGEHVYPLFGPPTEGRGCERATGIAARWGRCQQDELRRVDGIESTTRGDQNSTLYLSVIFLRISAVFCSSKVKTDISFAARTADSCFLRTDVERERFVPPP